MFSASPSKHLVRVVKPAAEAAESALDDVLCRWWHWQQCLRPVRLGFAKRAAFAAQYRTSRQYDDANGALDDDMEHGVMGVVDFQIEELAEPHRTAIHVHAKALAHGDQVPAAPRLPECPRERSAIVMHARALLRRRLDAAGVQV